MNPYLVVICDNDRWQVYRLKSNVDLMIGIDHVASLPDLESVYVYAFVYEYQVLVVIDDQNHTIYDSTLTKS